VQTSLFAFLILFFICLITFAIWSTSTTKTSLAHCECFLTFDTRREYHILKIQNFLSLLQSLWVSLSPRLLNRYNIAKLLGEIMQETIPNVFFPCSTRLCLVKIEYCNYVFYEKRQKKLISLCACRLKLMSGHHADRVILTQAPQIQNVKRSLFYF